MEAIGGTEDLLTERGPPRQQGLRGNTFAEEKKESRGGDVDKGGSASQTVCSDCVREQGVPGR